MRFRSILIPIVALFCVTPSSSIDAQVKRTPRLIVVVSVDQMRYDYFDRFESNFTGGLKRLWESGSVFSNAHHGHVPTNTGPGHASLATGTYPYQNGIVNNEYFDRETGEERYCIEDLSTKIVGVHHNGELPGRSPRALQTSTVGDWIKKFDSDSKVYSVSIKDRSAILMAGHKADCAFWFDQTTTKFVTSDYYKNQLPSWAEHFVGREVHSDFLEKGWEKLLPESAYAGLRPDEYDVEDGLFISTFPHTRERMRTNMNMATRNTVMMIYTPIGDRFTLDMAQAIVTFEELGEDSSPDLLMVGCSSADAIGHHFGPGSHEVMDYYMRLDKKLGEFFDFLDAEVGENNYWVVFTSDHGVIEMPEAMQERGLDAHRIPIDEFYRQSDTIEARLMEEWGLEYPIVATLIDGVYINYLETDQKGMDRADIRKRLAAEFAALGHFEDVFTSDEIHSKVERGRIDQVRMGHMKDKSPDLVYVLKENYLIHTETGTRHGSPHNYDTHVPIIFMGNEFKAQKVDRRVQIVDIAPTLAALLGMKGNKKTDGEVLREVVDPS